MPRTWPAWCALLVVVGCGGAVYSEPRRDAGRDATGSGGASAGGAGSGGTAGAFFDGGSSGGSGGAGYGCTSPGDSQALDATYDAGPSAQDVSNHCSIDCLLSGDTTDQCLVDCIEATTHDAFSPACVACLAGETACGRDNCVVDCLGSDVIKCDACLCGNNPKGRNCIVEFVQCSGRPDGTCALGGP